MGSTTYVVVASQLNRYDKDADELHSLKRGEEFTTDDVTPAELKRWLGLKPTVIADKAELQRAVSAHADAQSTIEELQAQLAAARDELREARAAGGSGDVLASPPPAKNASRDAWAEWVRTTRAGSLTDEDHAFLANEENDRKALQERFTSTS